MRHILLLLFLLLPCCSSPPKTWDEIDQEVSARNAPTSVERLSVAPAAPALVSVATALPQSKSIGALAAVTPRGPQVLSDSELSVTVSGHLNAVQTRDKSWLVQVGPDTRIVSYASSAGAVGAVLNLRGYSQVNPLTQQVAFGTRVVPSDALILVSGQNTGSSSSVDESMAVCFVAYSIGPGCLRPPAMGNSEATRWLRDLGPIHENMVDMARCPSVVDIGAIYMPRGPVNPNGWAAAPPTVDGILAEIGKFSGDYIDGWGVAYTAPSKQHKGYGTFFSGQVSTAMVMLVSTLPLEDRRKIALALVQRGIDHIGAMVDGRVLYPLGGHCQGRKALVMLVGHLMDIQCFADLSWTPPVFQEDICYRPRQWWFGAGWTVGWAYARESPWNGELLVNPPSTWGDRNSPTHSSWNWLFGYYGQVVPSQVGTALAIQLMGREREMGGMVQAVRQFMQGPPAAAQAQLRAAGHDIPWGQDYAVPAGFCATAWKLYGH